MRLQLFLIAGISLGISIQALASSRPNPNPPPAPAAPPKNAPAVIVPTAVPTATFTPVPPPAPVVKTPTPRVVVSIPTATPTTAALGAASPTPGLPGVTVWPAISKGGQSILFKAPSDPGTPIQLSIRGLSGQPVFQTTFSKTGRSGGHVWRLQNQSGAPVVGGVYVYVLSFKQQGQPVTTQGKITVVR